MSEPQPPMAERKPRTLTTHGRERVDDWYWLRERDDPDVIAYLEAENAHTDAATAHTSELRERLFEEIKSRILETDLSPPTPWGPYRYYARTEEGRQYPIHCRRGLEDAAAEQVLLDENVEAEGRDFFAVGAFEVSPDHRLLAWSSDVAGDERYTLRVRDLRSRADLPDEIPGTYYGVAWSATGSHVFYTTLDDAHRPHRLWRHELGTDASADAIVLQEDDDRFWMEVDTSRTGDFVTITLESKVTSEVHLIPTADPTAAPMVVTPRRQGVEYRVEHHRGPDGGRLFIVTNDDAEDFRLVEAPVAAADPDAWREVVPARDGVKLDAVDAFAGHLVLYERAEGTERMRVLRLADGDQHDVAQPEPAYSLAAAWNPEFDSTVVRFGYTSLVTPSSVVDYDVESRARTVVKQQPVLGGYDPADYETGRTWATAADGTKVPVSYVHRRGIARDGSNPLLLYGYGSYEISIDPTFSSLRLSLLDRGFVFAIAHIRGGGELGRRWYEDGKMRNKRNTFTDFIACAEHVIAEGFTAPDRLVCRGGSAGGLLIGAVLNMRPDLFAAGLAHVPFVDVVTTILDESLPLTITEWEEWGNPNEADVFDYMLSYSPYDNVDGSLTYPPMLVTAGLNDPRVQYWEPAKWVAKMRAARTDGNQLLLRTEMGAGHMGPSGRYEAWREEAFAIAFVLDTLGIA